MARTPNEDRNGVSLLGGLPQSNGLATIASRLIKDKTSITYGVFALRTKTIKLNVEDNSQTAQMKIVSLECDLMEEETEAIQLVLDRARVRRTGEEPLFDNAGMPSNVTELVSPPRGKR